MADDSAHGAKASVGKGSPTGSWSAAAAPGAPGAQFADDAVPRFNVPVDSENK